MKNPNEQSGGFSEHGDGVTLITGGAGFIGTNLADRLLSANRRVVIFDNLSRPGVEQNLEWLRQTHPERLQVEIGDIRDAAAVAKVVRGVAHVFHFAAQVAVTTSLDDPVHDFEVNACGTLNLLEALRRQNENATLIFTSTNKVYGHLNDVKLFSRRRRYEPVNSEEAAHGFGEDRSVSFHSPYGCSKGSADQYVLDYAHTFGLAACVFRMSCIYGPHQFGTEDQGWVAHFILRALQDKPITLYGDGKQVRDVLYVEDLVDAFLLAQRKMPSIKGRAFNIGGGPENTTSLLELTDLIGTLRGAELHLNLSQWRTADQRYYVSDTRRFKEATGWQTNVGVRKGVTQLYRWLVENRINGRHRPQASGIPAVEDVGTFSGSSMAHH